MSEEPNGFYREKLFQEMFNRFDKLELQLEAQNKEIAKVNNRLAWMLGWATGAGVVATLIFDYVKGKFFNH